MNKSLVIVPTYNEKDNIKTLVESVLKHLPDSDLLIIDDNSPDGTADIIMNLQKQHAERLYLEQREGKLGLGTAYLHGFTWAIERKYDFIFEMDADFSHDPASLPDLLAACKGEGYDLAIGSRYINGVNVVNWPIGRVLMSYYASAYVRLITGMPIRDATAGFKCYRRTTLEKVLEREITFVGYAFQIEMKFRTWKYGFKIKEVPIIFRDRTMGQSKMSGKIFNEAFWGVIGMKFNSWFVKWE